MIWSYQAMKRSYHAMKRPYRGLKRNDYLVRVVFGILIFELSPTILYEPPFACLGYGGDAIASYSINKKRGLYFRKILFRYVCDSGRIQTCNLLIRSQMLYSVELRSQTLLFCGSVVP